MRMLVNCRKLLLAVSAATLIMSPAWADDVSEVADLLRSRQFDAALAKADAHLEGQPKNPQMRFLKGLILSGMDRGEEAITVFNGLSADYPALPEPYNNLAVLYAASGQYDKARTALENAVNANPGYARAHENLGDIYAELASRSYATMLQLEPENANVRAKYSLIRSAINQKGQGSTPGNAAATTPARPAPAQVTSQLARSHVQPSQETPNVSDAEAARAEVLETLDAWAKAWSTRDVAAYLDFYGHDFRTPRKMSRTRWEAGRRARIEGKDFITVEVLKPEVMIEGDKAKASFYQAYKSNSFSDNEHKTMFLEKQGGKWKIVREGKYR